ncbi:MAG: threonine synthase [Candidatus Methanofastidiosum methylothiophilum]|uniref:Threonine synthase n=1 Tax=Candidatus Methanofastidiosum methylothiophilum TaxID=1705564 RepID=A0A150IKQ8_9EURY|nr:MAG: threonine synthase [Candidatus Methanofastidiosum methylthiophilus]KYC47690.1 MAG: threonine synthase [Candidatus Methanofastidiosum methylthiophilus]KYC50304.1 MAG: threonine synthase [Candidatus Methanofastidiosum methylthiophilus]
MGGIKYYSTNRNINEAGFVPFKGLVSFKDALMMGQAPDAGLFMPERIPNLSKGELEDLRGKRYFELAHTILEKFLYSDIDSDHLLSLCKQAYNFKIPIERVHDRKYVMRLDQGPTASFKDFAARMMARLMGALKDENKELNILVATSGDTGSAVGEAFKGLSGINVFILYPESEVSGRQKKQLDTIGDNVTTLAVDGKFDDCQNLVKMAFQDKDLTCLNLTSANSINIGRILPQMIYFFYAYLEKSEEGEKALISVPSGNFGNSLGCEFGRRMGLPLHKLIMAVNENDEFPRFLSNGQYQKLSPSKACISSAMNVGHPSNLARFFELYGGTVDKSGKVHKYPDINKMKANIYSTSISDQKTRDTIKNVYEKYKIVLEPHGAVGWAGLESYYCDNGDYPLSISLETAHPAKFPEEVNSLLGFEPELPDSMKDVDRRQGCPIRLENDYLKLKKFLESTLENK